MGVFYHLSTKSDFIEYLKRLDAVFVGFDLPQVLNGELSAGNGPLASHAPDGDNRCGTGTEH